MKNKDVYDLYEGLYEISQNNELKLDIKVAFTLAKNKNILQPIFNAIAETREKLLYDYGEQLENGDWKIPKERLEDFSKKWKDFMDIDNFVNLQKIKLNDIQDEKIRMGLIEKLLPIIDE